MLYPRKFLLASFLVFRSERRVCTPYHLGWGKHRAGFSGMCLGYWIYRLLIRASLCVIWLHFVLYSWFSASLSSSAVCQLFQVVCEPGISPGGLVRISYLYDSSFCPSILSHILHSDTGFWRGFVLEFFFPAPDGSTYKMTSQTAIIPNTYPFPSCVPEGCMKSLVYI